MAEPTFLLFASDATLVGLWGGALLLFAVAAMLAERRRARRKRIDAVGWVPWTTLFVIAFFVGIGLLVVAVKGWLAS
jgi:hypothetical protein